MRKRVLIGTNQLEQLSGSETVALEFARYFQQQGARVSIFANWKAGRMEAMFRHSGLRIETRPAEIRPFTYDLVYLQHQVAPLFNYEAHERDREATTFAIGRLSPDGFLESGGWAHDSALADVTLANSHETARSLIQQGVTGPLRVFHNAAPQQFHQERRRPLPGAPSRILVVTNHARPEVLAIIEELRRRARVLHVGRSGRVAPVRPSCIQSVDLVVCIGKTVQYALAGRTPVFVYGHLGGPGYLTRSNFAPAADLNFSGRCTPGVRPPAIVADEIFDSYEHGRRFALSVDDAFLSPYFLPGHLDWLLDAAPSSNRVRREKLLSGDRHIDKERMVAQHSRRLFQKLQVAKAAQLPATVAGSG